MTIKDSVRVLLTPESAAEEAAIAWIKDHVPIFAESTDYGLAAFVAGFEAGQKCMSTEKHT